MKFTPRLLALLLLLATTAAAQIPTSLGWYSIPNTTFTQVAPSGQAGSAGCPAGDTTLVNCVTGAWSSGAADIVNNRLYFTGGGHGNYSGNEVYYLDLNNLTMNRLTNPPAPSGASCPGVNDVNAGQPNSRHTYGGLSYFPSSGQLWLHAGATYPCGNSGDVSTWLLDTSTLTWTLKDPLSGTQVTANCCNYQSFGDYDPVTDSVWYTDAYDLWSYKASTNAQTHYSQPFFNNQAFNCVVDYDARKFTCAGGGEILQADMTATTPALNSIATSNCATMVNDGNYPGLDYDPVLKKVVYWNGGNSVILFDSNTHACTTQTFTGGPTVTAAQGTFNRLRYFPSLGVHAVVNTATSNAFTLRLTAYDAAMNNFMQRCAQPGVIVCEGFDEAGGIPHNDGAGSGGTSGASISDLSTYPSQDTSVFASGGGSMHFVIPTPSGPSDPNGYWRQNFCRLLSCTGGSSQDQLFVGGTTFYVQFRQRMTSAYITNTWGGSTWWKQVILAESHSTCGWQEITTVNGNNDGFPQAYSHCGSDSYTIDLGNGDFLLEQGDVIGGTTVGSGTGYNCHYQGTSGPPNQCFLYPANTWVTFTYKVQIGTFGQPNSVIQAWATVNGQTYPTHEWINMQNKTLNLDGGSELPGFNFLELAPYFTAGYSNASGTPETWYDELIVSSNPIAAPGAPSQPVVASPTFSPTAGTYSTNQTVTISSTTGGAIFCYTTDGTTPTANGAGGCTHGMTYSIPVVVSSTVTVNAIGTESGFNDSAVTSGLFVINTPNLAPANAIFSFLSGRFSDSSSVRPFAAENRTRDFMLRFSGPTRKN